MTFPIEIDNSWTLFLDRDGVINARIVGGYVKTINEFILLPDVAETIAKFNKQFGRVVVVTNQQGIGKGLMTSGELSIVHDYFRAEIAKANASVDKIYHAPYLAQENHAWRKPKIGMAQQAQKDFPTIDFTKSVMIGDSISDMQFGKNAGMKTIFIGTDENEWSDYCASSLAEILFIH